MTQNFRIPMSKPDIRKEEEESILEVLRTNWPSQGKVTEEFERMLSEYLSSKAIVVNNGSSALMCALLAHGLKPGDKVLVPAFTFVASSSIPKILGSKIMVADIDPETLSLSPETVEKMVKQKDVKFVINVDVGGLPSDIDSFVELSKRYHFTLIEDAAQAFGSEYKNKKLGSFEHTSIFSFQITKQVTTIEGGCIATTDESILKKISQIKDYGRNKTEMYVHDIIGSNFRTTDIQSAMGIRQLRRVEEHISRRNQIANEYRHKIKGVDFQKIPKYVTRHSYMIFFALAKNEKDQNEYINNLTKNGIDARKSWLPIHMQPCNPELHDISCNSAKNVFEKVFTVPIYNSMTLDEAQTVIKYFRKD